MTNSMHYDRYTNAWLQAIEVATICLRSRSHRGRNEDDRTMTALDGSLAYLDELERIITSSSLEDAPRQNPPPFDAYSSSSADSSAAPGNSPLVPVQALRSTSHRHTSISRLASNAFSSLSPDDDLSGDDGVDFVIHNNDDFLEAGDRPLPLPPYPTRGSTKHMDGLRLWIRICTGSADLWAFQGYLRATRNLWTEGVESLQQAIANIRQALELADTQISAKLAADPNNGEHHGGGDNSNHKGEQDEGDRISSTSAAAPQHSHTKMADLEQDADIVHVATQSLVTTREGYLVRAHRQIRKLEQILEPQWESRDAAMEKMGKDRWKNNSAPKRDHAKLREKAEGELYQLRAALVALDPIILHGLQTDAESLKVRLHQTQPQQPF